MKLNAIFLMLLAIVVIAPTAEAVWDENFDSYANGSGLIGQGGWEGWDDNPATDAYVTNFVSLSAPHSVDVTPTTDVVHQFEGYTSGLFTITAWQYIPSSATGEQYFILLDDYSHGGTYHWALQLVFANGLVESQWDGLALSLIYDQWVQIFVEINLDVDDMAVYYDGVLLFTREAADPVHPILLHLEFGEEFVITEMHATGWIYCWLVDESYETMGNNGGKQTVSFEEMTPVDDATWGSIKALFQ